MFPLALECGINHQNEDNCWRLMYVAGVPHDEGEIIGPCRDNRALARGMKHGKANCVCELRC